MEIGVLAHLLVTIEQGGAGWLARAAFTTPVVVRGGEVGGGMMCSVLEAWKGSPYRLPWQGGLLICELLSISSSVTEHLKTKKPTVITHSNHIWYIGALL
jgi:hypothetical protein